MPLTRSRLIVFRILLLLIIVFILASCAGVTPDQAASRNYRKCRPVR